MCKHNSIKEFNLVDLGKHDAMWWIVVAILKFLEDGS